MNPVVIDENRLRAAWSGRVSGCMLGKPVEVLSFREGHAGLTRYLQQAGALPLRDYVPLLEDTAVAEHRDCCRNHIVRGEPDDDINYTVLALLMLEEYGARLDTEAVARSWLKYLPAGMTFTAEREAYATLLQHTDFTFSLGDPAGFDLRQCADNAYSDWIGAQIRADLYGWVCPGKPSLAAGLAARDAALSHRGDGVYGAVFVAALGAAIPVTGTLSEAIDTALDEVPSDSGIAACVAFARDQVGEARAVERIHQHYAQLNPVHTLNNLCLVVWALLSWSDDFTAAIGNVVAAGLDTDCNGATVGGLWGLQGKPIPAAWTQPWQGRIAVSLAGIDELGLDQLVQRTAAVAHSLAAITAADQPKA